MPKLEKAYRRDKKRQKSRYGLKVDSKSVFTIQRETVKRAQK